jgi:hypothetical protein
LSFLRTAQQSYPGVPPEEGIAQLQPELAELLDTACRADSVEAFENAVDKLADLEIKVVAAIEESRNRVCKTFVGEAAHLKKPVAIVTYGYSKTVRECLRALCAGSREMTVFVAASGDGDQQLLDAQRMVHELVSEGQNPLDRQRVIHGEIPRELIGMSGTVVFLLGAEAFDALGWVMHPRGAYERIRAAMAQADGNPTAAQNKGNGPPGPAAWNLKVMVVAEAYKQHPDIAHPASGFSVANQEHLSLYRVGCICTDRGVLPQKDVELPRVEPAPQAGGKDALVPPTDMVSTDGPGQPV